MAGELVSFGIQKLYDLLSHECEQLRGVKDQVATLESDLKLLDSFLEDADAKKHTSAVVRKCVEEIKEIVFDAEDQIETYLLKKELGKTSKSIKKRVRTLACIIPDRREIASDMRSISNRISKVIQDMKNFEVQQTIANVGDSQPLQERLREMRQEFPREYKNDLVGLEANVKELVGYLVEKDDVQVVSMTGMGGLGKTTLARQAFNHDTVKNKFDKLAWVCVSQVFNRKNVWQRILQNFRSKEEEKKIMEMTEDTLHDELFQLLETSKSLIVFDDIWKEEHWNLIKPIFPPQKGWKVLLTSRNENVAGRGDTTYINFKPKCLTTDESWILFQMIAIPRKDASELIKLDGEMEKMGKEMIKHCGGLPLAVRVLGGLLYKKYTLHEWKRVSENLGSHLCGRPDSFYHVLSLSFEELPSKLKHCFLYLAHFPEDYQIRVDDLSYYWAAEGVLKPGVRDVADDYIEELVQRNMVISERDMETLRFETCHLHDMMREVCLLKAKEENFLQIVEGTSTGNTKSPCKSRRLAVHLHDENFNVVEEMKNPSLRSILFINPFVVEVAGDFLFRTRLQLLRVLHLHRAKFKGGKLPYGIGKLIHLRYLNLEYAKVSHLPSSLGNLRLLIYLNLLVWESIFVPNVLMGMKELRYLALPWNMSEKTKLELSNLKKLETLENFSTQNCSLEDLRGMARLRTLKIKLIGETSLEKLSASIGGMIHLENLRINGDEFAMKKIEKGFVLDAVNLRQLKLKGIYMPKFPDERRFPSYLTTIFLENCGLEEDPMPILEKLLQLKEVYLREGSFCGRRMVCSAGGFPQLQELTIVKLDELEEWIVEEGSMPLLHTLQIRYFPKLKKLPDGLRFLTSLKELQLWNLDELEEWIVEEGSMPLLHTLSISNCRKLKKLPDGLRFLTSLKELALRSLDELEEWIVEEGSMPLLHTLYISNCRKLKKLPDGLRFLTSLKELELYGLDELEEWIVEEGYMPLLHTLRIDYCRKLKKLPDGLRFLNSLKELHLSRLHELEEWIVEEGSMPLLHTLEIVFCEKLKELPDGLRFLTSLKDLTCHGMGEEWKERLSEGGEDYYKVQHIPSVTFSEKAVPDGLRILTSLKDMTCQNMGEEWKRFLMGCNSSIP